MKIVLYSINYAPELTGVGKYNAEFCEHIAASGHDVTVVTAVPYYPEWKIFKGYKNRWFAESMHGVDVYRCPLYVPAELTTVRRLFHLLSFACSSMVSLLRLIRSRPDVVIILQPTFFTVPMGLLWSQTIGARTVLHIQDFELDAMRGISQTERRACGHVPKRDWLATIESFLMRRFDRVSTISQSMLKITTEKGVDPEKLLFFPNWADTSHMRRVDVVDAIRAEFGFQRDDRVILYSGNIGKKQGLDLILDAARAFRSKPEVKFLIIGTGAHAEKLQARVREQELESISFAPLQPWERLPAVLSMADIHLVLQKRGVADAVLPSKLTNILAIGGHALVTAEAHTELGSIARAHPGIYTVVEPETPPAFIEALENILERDTRAVNTIATTYASVSLEKHAVIDTFMKDLTALIPSNTG